MPTSKAYYNEWDLKAAAWLRALIKEGLIADGDVDSRSIREVRASDLAGYTQVHFFAGIGGWSLALRLAGWDDSRPVWTGSCPCQPFSQAGKQKGFADDRHLWPAFKQLIEVGRPSTVFGEQVASAADWLRLVRGDLEGLGYAVGAMPVEAASAGADHLRDRYFFVADANYEGSQGRPLLSERESERAAGQSGVADTWRTGTEADGVADAISVRQQQSQGRLAQSGQRPIDRSEDGNLVNGAGERRGEGWAEHEVRRRWSTLAIPSSTFDWATGADGKERRVKPGVRLLVDGFPCRVGLLRGFGNAIDPRAAAAFIQASIEAMK